MRPLLLVVRRELQERLAARSFRIFTVGLFLLSLVGIVAIDQASTVLGEPEFELAIVGEAPTGFEEALRNAASELNLRVTLRHAGTRESAAALVQEGEIDAFLNQGELVYGRDERPLLSNAVNRALYVVQLPGLLEQANITPEQAQELLNLQPAQIAFIDPEASDEVDRRFIGFLAAIGLYLTLAIYGNWILTGVVEEKATRIVEVLLGLLRPHELLTGKTIGIVLVAVGQLLVAVLGALAGLAIVGADLLPAVAVDVIAATIPLYILGVVLYALIYAAIGATVTRQADAQAASTPIVMLLLIPYMYAAIFVPENPDGLAATVLSIVPFTSPLIMPTRVATGSPDAVQLVACYLLLLPAIALMAWVGGRVYASAIMSGRNEGIVSLLRAVVSFRGEAR